MWKRIDLETKLGGLFGLIAITAIVIEMALNSFSSEVLITGIRDMAGTMVGVMVFIIAIKSITRNSLKNLSEKLEFEMKNWTKNNIPMVFKVNDFADVEAYTQGFSILSDLTTFLDKSIGLSEEEILSYSSQKTKKTGKFVDLPSNEKMLNMNFKIKFNFIKSTGYGDGTKDFVDETVKCISGRFKEYGFIAKKVDKSHFSVAIPKLSTEEQIRDFFSLLDFTLLLYAIQS